LEFTITITTSWYSRITSPKKPRLRRENRKRKGGREEGGGGGGGGERGRR